MRRAFLDTLLRMRRSRFESTDVQDVAEAMGISLSQAEAIAVELRRERLVERVGLGNNLRPTDKGRSFIANPEWQ
jgi:DNA-binding IclR family transcriptional regulator